MPELPAQSHTGGGARHERHDFHSAARTFDGNRTREQAEPATPAKVRGHARPLCGTHRLPELSSRRVGMG